MFKKSTAVPAGAAARAARVSVLLMSGALVLGSCSLVGPLGGKVGTPSKPVRVESREDAATRVERIQDHVRELTGLERYPFRLAGYWRCPGRGTGIADEGEAYQLSSAITLKTTDDRRPEVLRTLREKLAREGFKTTSDLSGSANRSASPTGEFEAAHEPDPYTVSVMGETKGGQDAVVLVTVVLPCQAPPTGAASLTPTATA